MWHQVITIWVFIAHKNKGEFDKAIEFFEKALKKKMDTFGEDHPNTQTVNCGLERAKKAKAESSNTQGCKCVIS